ncbi:MAG: hypothetical protein FVQ81_06055 [Candidatus Glassbacteria bacterium]|nr:hypothetical protein [Candidatus Glassbacteria bacterium]
MKNLILLTAAVAMLAFAATLPAQEAVEEVEEIEVVQDVSQDETGWESDNWATIERGINVMTPRTIRKNSLLFLVEHRTRKQFDQNSFHDLAGFDAGGLKVGLGLRYAPADNLELGFYRLNGQSERFDTYEFDLKYRMLRQDVHGIDLAARAGLSWFAQDMIDDASGFIGQLLAGGKLNKHLRIGTGLLLHTESSSELKNSAEKEYSVAVPFQLEVRFNGRFVWEFEAVTPVAGFTAPHPVISTGLKILTWRHTFTLVVSNSQYMSADGIVAGSHRALDDAVVGFCITREFGL